MTLPSRSTTQMCVSFIEMSKPAKYSMGAPPVEIAEPILSAPWRAAVPLPRVEKLCDEHGARNKRIHEAANVMLTRYRGDLALKEWALRIGKRSTMRKARVALARRLAIIKDAMLRDGTDFQIA